MRAKQLHGKVMRLLIRRYVTHEQRTRDDYGITEDDVMEIRQDISALKYELIDILRQNGMKTPALSRETQGKAIAIRINTICAKFVCFSIWKERKSYGKANTKRFSYRIN